MTEPVDEQLRLQRQETARLAARVEELKSAWSYKLAAPVRLIERAVKSGRKRRVWDNLALGWAAVLRYLYTRSDAAAASYQDWIHRFDRLTAGDNRLIASDIAQLRAPPKISVIILPGSGPDQPTWDSLARQLYPHFEIMASRPAAAPFERADIDVRPIPQQPGAGPAELFNAAVAEAAGEFCLAVEAGDVLPRHALYLYARAASDRPGLDLIYGDEDDLTPQGYRARPFFKPSWNPQLALSFDYVGRTALYRTGRLRALGGGAARAGDAWRWDLLLRAMDGADRASRSARVPFVVLHRCHASVEPRPAEFEAGLQAVTEALARQDRHAAVGVDPRGWLTIAPAVPHEPPHVSIIVATRDRVDLLRACVDGILRRTAYPRFDITIVDNRSREPETFTYFETVRSDPRVTIVPYPEPFNFSALHNAVIPNTRGDLIAFVNNDIDVIGERWLERMAAFAARPEVGIAGAKLYYPDDIVQHAGAAVEEGLTAMHIYNRGRRDDPGPRGILAVARDVSAVTAACMVMRRSVFDECGGFDETFTVEFNDTDLCMRVRSRGYRIIFVADAELYHHESATRGTPLDAANWRRHLDEVERMRGRWSARIAEDPLYNPNLSPEAALAGLAFPPRTQKPWLKEAAGSVMAPPAPEAAAAARPGVAIYGLFHSDIGAGQAARGLAAALATTAIPYSCHLGRWATHPDAVPFTCSTDAASDYDTAIVVVDAVDLVSEAIGNALPLAGKRRIGFWSWELPVFPARWARAFDRIDEIWVPSRFVADALSPATATNPVAIVPPSVSARGIEKRAARERLRISQDEWLLVAICDADSPLARTNPAAAVRAFIDAFPRRASQPVRLLIRLPRSADAAGALRPLAGDDDRIALLDPSVRAADLIAASDALVSLHRSDAFGLTIAEAMAAGRLAIATGFSGNTDFMTAENSLLVPYRIRAVLPSEYPQGTGQWWAEPEHDAAVAALRTAVADRALAARLAGRARLDLERDYSPAAAGRRIASALGRRGPGGIVGTVN